MAVRMILEDLHAKRALITYLKEELSEEAVLFYDAVENLNRVQKSGNAVHFFASYQDVCGEFIATNAIHEINISFTLKQALLTVKSLPPSVENSMLIMQQCRLAQGEIVVILTGVLPRFQSSKVFKDWSSAELPNRNKTFSTRIKPGKFLEILIVDDCPLMQKILSRTLKGRNFLVTVAENGKVAYEKAVEHEFPLILIDCEMPVLSGVEGIRQIRSFETRLIQEQGNHRKPSLILAMSSYASMRVSALEAGADAFIDKPVTFNELLKVFGLQNTLKNPRQELRDFLVDGDDSPPKRPTKSVMPHLSSPKAAHATVAPDSTQLSTPTDSLGEENFFSSNTKVPFKRMQSIEDNSNENSSISGQSISLPNFQVNADASRPSSGDLIRSLSARDRSRPPSLAVE